MFRGSSLCAWLYTLILSLLNGVVGGGLAALCHKSFSTPSDGIGIVLRLCLVAGIAMLVFVVFWIIFIFCSWRTSGQISKECHQMKGQASSRTSSKVTSLLGLLSLIMLTISILMDLFVTGMLWWTSQQIGDQYQVMGDCFCVVGSEKSGNKVIDLISVNCPEVEGYVCEVVFGSALVTIDSVTVFTSECQRLDGGPQDPACLEYLTFWNLFKVLRIVLPILALINLPVLLGNCSRWLVKGDNEKNKSSQGKFATDSISWIGLDVLISPLKLVDPVLFYSDICTPVGSRPPLGERLGPVGQEHDGEGSLQAKQTTTRNSILITKSTNSYRKHSHIGSPVPPYGVVHAEPPSRHETQAKDDSPPDIGKHTISTPKHPKLQTPSFDLSKVVQPVLLNTSMDTEVPARRIHIKPVGNHRHNRLSSFSSSHDVKIPPPPPLPKPFLSEFKQTSRHPPPPFSRSTTTLPKPVRISSSGTNPLPSEPTTCNQLSTPPRPTVQLVEDSPAAYSEPSDSGQSCSPIVRLGPPSMQPMRSSPSWQGPRPLQLSSSIREISQKARNRSSSHVDWTKLP